MPKTITLDEALRMLASHDYEAFRDVVETGHLEFKNEPYRLDQELQKQARQRNLWVIDTRQGVAMPWRGGHFLVSAAQPQTIRIV